MSVLELPQLGLLRLKSQPAVIWYPPTCASVSQSANCVFNPQEPPQATSYMLWHTLAPAVVSNGFVGAKYFEGCLSLYPEAVPEVWYYIGSQARVLTWCYLSSPTEDPT